MIAKHVDILAVLALLLGMLICSEVRQSFWAQIIKGRSNVSIEQISIRVPDPPAVPIVFRQ